MKDIIKGCTYWYEVAMNINQGGDNYFVPAKIRIPVACISTNKDESIITYLNPSSAKVETIAITNERLFDDPIPPKLPGCSDDNNLQQQLTDLQESLKASQEEVERLKSEVVECTEELYSKDIELERERKRVEGFKEENKSLSNELESCRADKSKT